MPQVRLHLERQGKVIEKPPYRVPSMAEIKAIPSNGYKVVSTFSGCGGSCLGYRIAGLNVVWANEFIEAARESYKANHPASILDPRDIRMIEPDEILRATRLARGELDLLDGSPPCASFSTAGKRERGWGKVKAYSETAQRVDDLFFEYVRIVLGVQRRVFVAENVSGLIKGTAKGFFIEILAALKSCGYRVKARLLDAQWLGVPQARQRLIFIGVREDLGLDPAFPSPLPFRYSVREALPWVVRGKYGPEWKKADGPSPTVSASLTYNPATSHQGLELIEAETDISRYAIGAEWDRLAPGEKGRYLNFVKPELDAPCPTVTQAGGNLSSASVVHPTEKRKFTIAELRRICGFPDDFILTGSYAQQWERLGRAVPPIMMKAIAETIRDRILGVIDHGQH